MLKHGSVRRRVGIAAACAVALVALVVPTPREVRVVSGLAPIALTLWLDGEEVARVERREASVRLGAPLFRTDAGLLDAIEVRVASPCGTFALDRARYERRVPPNGRPKLEVYPSEWRLTVDNREQPATTLRFGALPLAVRAGAVERYSVPVGGCEGPQPLTLGARELGTVTLRGLSPGGMFGGVVVDPTARRCYRLRAIAYGARPDFAAPLAEESLAPAAIHAFPIAPHHVLEAAPPRVRVWSDRRSPTFATELRQLVDEPCAP